MSQRTFEAVIDEHGNARFPDAVRLPQGTKVTVLVEERRETEQFIDLPPLKPGSIVRIPSVRIVRNADAKPLSMEMTNAAPETVTRYEDIIAGLPGLTTGDKRIPAFRVEKHGEEAA